MILAAVVIVFAAGALYIRHYGRGFGSMAERVSYLRSASVMAAEKPLSGHGWGEFFYRHMQLKDTSSNESAHDPHNVVVSFAVHTGIIGGIFALAAFLLPLWNLWKKREELDLLTTLCLWGAAAGFIHALQDINLQSSAVIGVLMLILLVNQSDPQDAPVVKPAAKYSILFYMLVLGAVSFAGNLKYTKGDAALSMLEECCRPSVKEKFYLATPYNVEKYLKIVNELRPEHPFARNLAGAFFFARNDIARAEKYYRESLKLDSRRPGVMMKLADICEMQGNTAEAEKLRLKAHKLFPSNPEYRPK